LPDPRSSVVTNFFSTTSCSPTCLSDTSSLSWRTPPCSGKPLWVIAHLRPLPTPRSVIVEAKLSSNNSPFS
jgi:hypothetical protein